MFDSCKIWALKDKLWLSEILHVDPFDKQLCYCTCLRKIFKDEYHPI